VTLHLLPNLLDDSLEHTSFVPKSVDAVVMTMDGLIAESEKSARAFLKRFSFVLPKSFRDVPIRLLNEHTQESELAALLLPIERGESWGLVSDCGLPCLADPGANLVLLAHKHGVKVRSYPGPSSIILALQLSGLSGQCFAFHGYPEKEKGEMQRQVRMLEAVRGTHIFIEAPYRSLKFLEQLLGYLSDRTLLCIASDLSLPTESILTQSVADWKRQKMPDLHKHPAIFLFSGKNR